MLLDFTRMCWTVVFVIVLIPFLSVSVAGQNFGGRDDYDFGSCSQDQVRYDWQRLNYYELLGLATNDEELPANSLDSKDIRKAYRQQAQNWHPDKRKANETLTIEEINARFSSIGQAYNTLNDPEKRQAYNRFLRNCQYMRGRSSSYYNSKGYGNRYDSNPSYFDNDYSNYQENSSSAPTSIQKDREMLIDPRTGIPILRETTYQEFHEENYYRITIQDFDPYHQPLYRYPQVVDEGEIYHPHDYYHQQQYHQDHNYYDYEQQQQQRQSPQQAPSKSKSTDTLEEGSVLRDGQALFSNNQQYRAHVDNCQLVVETRQEKSNLFEPEIKLIWQSPNYVPEGFGIMECFLALEDGQLMIAGGSPELHNGQILWFSNADDDLLRDLETFGGFATTTSHTYTARLENDGKLVVYRVSQDHLDETQETCIYATGLFGCVRLANKLVWATRFAKDKLTLFWDLFLDARSNPGGDEKHHRQGYFNDDEEDGKEGNLTRLLLRTALSSLTKLNKARRRIEIRLEERSLRLVYHVESWLQERQQRF